MVRRVRADRERQSMAIHNRHDFHAFSALCGSDLCPAAFRHNEGRVNEAFFFIEGTSYNQHAAAMPIQSGPIGNSYMVVWMDDRGTTYDIWGRTFP